MVFGNRGLSSGAGVAFSRDPSTGVGAANDRSCVRRPGRRRRLGPPDAGHRSDDRPLVAGHCSRNCGEILRRLEQEFGDVQDVEFTVEDGKLWILQTRSAKRTPRAALRIAIDLVHEKLITQQEALQRLAGIDLAALVQIALVSAEKPVIAGIGASGGIAVGRAAFCSESAQRLAAAGDPVILMRPDTSTADVAGFAVAARHSDFGRGTHRPCRARRAPDGEALRCRMQWYDGRRRSRSGTACGHFNLGERLDHHRRRRWQHLPRTA